MARYSAFLACATMALLVALPPVRSDMEALAVRHALRRAGLRTVREMGLPADRDHLALYRAAMTPLPPLTLFSDAAAGARADGRAAPFTKEISHADLRAGGSVTVGVYIEPPETWADLLPGLAPAMEAAAARGVVLQPLRTEADFREALRTLPVVAFIGHANYGRGMVLAGVGGRSLVRLPGAATAGTRGGVHDGVPGDDPDRLPPDLRMSTEPLRMDRCRLFMYLGCRTEPYYGEALAQRHPETALVLGNYLWDATGFADEGLRLLLSGLAHERTLAEILDRWEARVRPHLLLARARERNRFGVSGPWPDRMLTYRPPARSEP